MVWAALTAGDAGAPDLDLLPPDMARMAATMPPTTTMPAMARTTMRLLLDQEDQPLAVPVSTRVGPGPWGRSGTPYGDSIEGGRGTMVMPPAWGSWSWRGVGVGWGAAPGWGVAPWCGVPACWKLPAWWGVGWGGCW